MAISKHVLVPIREDQYSQGELNAIHVQDTQPLPVQPGKQKPKRQYVYIGMLLFLFLAGSISSAVGYLVYHTYDARYQADLSLAQTGIQHLQKAEALLAAWPQKALDPQFGSRAESEFASALKNFSLLNSDLTALPAFVRQVPAYSARLDSALRLVPLAMTLSKAGVAGCGILNTLVTGLHDPLTPQGHGITPSDLAAVNQDVTELTVRARRLQPGRSISYNRVICSSMRVFPNW